MNIDLEKAREEFLKYTEKFSLEDENVKRKQQHSLRVMEISHKIAAKIGLTQEKIDIATLIGLLHDIGRFKQYTEIRLGDNIEGFDHGDYGAKILEKDIRKYISDRKYDNIIIKAVKNHNKFAIEEGLTDEELLFSKIIRDADKIDIFYEAFCMFWKNNEKEVENEIISDYVFNQFKSHMLIKRNKDDNLKIDSVVKILAFVFDINFKPTFEILKKEDYINKIISRFDFKKQETKEKMEEIGKIVNQYVKENTK